MNKAYHNIKIITISSIILFQCLAFGACLPQPIESFYTIKNYGIPHFHLESLDLDQDTFVELMDEVHRITLDRAFLIEVPNDLYSDNVEKLRAARFFLYVNYPEHDATIWCRTNGSGIPLAATHTSGARCIVYYKENNEYYFLLINDRYGFKGYYEVPGGSVQVADYNIIEAFEKGHYPEANLNYRSPEEVGISEVLEEANFDLTKYGYGPEGTKKPVTIAQFYFKNTKPWHGIHSANDCRQYLLFQVSPNKDPLKKQDHEVLDVRWASATEILNNQINGPNADIHAATDNVKTLIRRVIAGDKYKKTRRQLIALNKKLQDLIPLNNNNINEARALIEERFKLEEQRNELEVNIKQSYSRNNNSCATYFAPF